MHIEFRHLRTIKAIHDTGSVARAADQLNITQSALSHQIKGIEEQAGVELFVRRSKPLRLSAAGLRMLAAAERILPEVDALEAEFEGLISGKLGRMHIAIECHACFEWLFPVMDGFRRAWPQVDMDIRPNLAFDAMTALRREEVDFVVSSDPIEADDITFIPLFDYEPMMIAPADHPIAEKAFAEAEDFLGQTLLTYPVDRSKLDVFASVLTPAGIEPAAVRQVELTPMILMLVASGRGVAVLPDWVLRQVWTSPDYVVRSISEGGLTRRMYAAVRSDDVGVPYVAYLTRLARREAVLLQRR